MGSRILALSLFSILSVLVCAQISDTPTKTIRAGKDAVTAFCVSPKGDQLLVGTMDGAVLCHIGSAKKVHAFSYSEDGGTAVYHVGFNDNGAFAVLIGHSGRRAVWDVTSGKQDRMINPHRWIPDPRAVKAMGLDLSNSSFDRFYQQTEVELGDLRVRSARNGSVEFIGAEGKVVYTLKFPENKDEHHKAPLLVWERQLLVGADDGRVLFYDVR